MFNFHVSILNNFRCDHKIIFLSALLSIKTPLNVTHKPSDWFPVVFRGIFIVKRKTIIFVTVVIVVFVVDLVIIVVVIVVGRDTRP